MTVNETMHVKRYIHFWKGKEFVNPFNRGSGIANIKDWWNPYVSWYTTYRADQLNNTYSEKDSCCSNNHNHNHDHEEV
jgi:hypothetical protein